MIHPLDLPEIAALVASLLPKKAILQCMLVSRHWLGLFTPALWRSICVSSTNAPVLCPGLTLNSSLVRSLTVTNLQQSTYDPLLMLPYPRLHSLSLTISMSIKSWIQSQSAVRDLIVRQGHTLRSLDIQANRNRPTIRIISYLWGCTAQLSGLRSLSLRNVTIELHSLDESARQLLGDSINYS
jgi:hypothetical protein